METKVPANDRKNSTEYMLLQKFFEEMPRFTEIYDYNPEI
jgi:hypothetical protein